MTCTNYVVNRKFAATIPRKFNVKYNPYTQSVEVLDNINEVTNLATELKGECEYSLPVTMSAIANTKYMYMSKITVFTRKSPFLSFTKRLANFLTKLSHSHLAFGDGRRSSV